MVYVYIAIGLGVVGVVALSLFALHLFKVVKAFGREVARVSDQLGSATSHLERAVRTSPNLQNPAKPES